MTQEQEFFIQLLSDHLAKRSTQRNDHVDWEKLAHISRIHQVDGIVFYQCREFMPSAVRSMFEQAFSATLYYFINRERDYNEIRNAFNTQGVSHFTIKGLEVAGCYPIPALRTMGDLDIIVQREDKEKAGRILELLGFAPGEKAPDYDWAYRHNGMLYELHHQFLYDEVVTRKDQASFFNNYWDYVKNGKLDWSFHFLFLLAHLRKHMMNSGAGFRMFLDIAAVIKADPGFNWHWIEEKLQVLGMEKFSKICFALIERWFQVKAPIHYPALEEDFAEKATEKIFANGIFGFQDEKNSQNAAANGILKHGNARNLSRVLMVLGHMFPKYIHMRYIPAYKFIDGKPWRLPVAWMYRFIRLMMGKTGGTKQFMEKVKTSNKDVDAREEELRQWGLIE